MYGFRYWYWNKVVIMIRSNWRFFLFFERYFKICGVCFRFYLVGREEIFLSVVGEGSEEKDESCFLFVF